jgi:hypothetical protein
MSNDNLMSIDKIIQGDNWSVTPLPAKQGMGMLKRLTKVFGESFAVMMENGQEGGISLAVQLLVENLDKDDVVDIAVKLTSTVKKNGKDINFDLEFTRRYGLLLEVLKFIITENYSDLFPTGVSENKVVLGTPAE